MPVTCEVKQPRSDEGLHGCATRAAGSRLTPRVTSGREKIRATIPLMTENILALLVAERDKLNRAIEALQGPVKRRGRPPKTPSVAAAPVALLSAPSVKKRKGGMTAAARKAQSQRMKAYWAAKRKKVGKK